MSEIATDAAIFDDELHQLMNFPRPKTEKHTDDLTGLLVRLFHMCNSRNNNNNSSADANHPAPTTAAARWKRLVLSLIHKRYHILSPEAKAMIRGGGGGGRGGGRGGGDDDYEDDGKTVPAYSNDFVSSAGDGERKLFYHAIVSMLADAIVLDDDDTKETTKDVNDKVKAFGALLKAAPLAGGSRDVCSILEGSLSFLLCHHGVETTKAAAVAVQQDASTTSSTLLVSKEQQEKDKTSLVQQVGNGIRFLTDKFLRTNSDDSNPSVHKHLEALLQLAAQTLDQDLNIVREEGSNKKEDDAVAAAAASNRYKTFPSTLHVFLPHRDRGRISSSKKKRKAKHSWAKGAEEVPHRHVVNSVAELLIWSRTNAAMSQPAFAHSFQEFLGAFSKTTKNKNAIVVKDQQQADGDKSAKKAALHTMQTIIRKLRKELNDYARNCGFMLTNQFTIDPSAVTLDKVCMGKSADLALLTAIAKKKGSTRVMQMVQNRFASDPTRIAKFGSIHQICKDWTSSMSYNQDDELDVLERNIQVSRLEATLAYLRKVLNQKGLNMKQDEEENGTTLPRAVVASMDIGKANDITAILVAAAMGLWEIEEEAKDCPSKAPEERVDAVVPAAAAAVAFATISSKEVTKLEPKLFVGGRERRMGSFQECIQLLDQIVQGSEKNEADAPSFMDDQGVSTTKAVINMIDRHVADGETLLLITSADIRLPEDAMKGLTARGCSLHFHDADDIGWRLLREEADKGDITISLAWDTYDDLDLHVTIPGGERLCFWKKVSSDSKCELDVDMNARPPRSAEPVENVYCGNLKKSEEAPRGHYKVEVQNYAYHTDDQTAAIPFRVVVEKNNQKERFNGECKGSDEASNVVVCEFVYEGRTVPFPRGTPHTAAFATANLINITSSTGQTLEALANLVQIIKQHKHLDDVQKLNDVEQDETMAHDGVAMDDVGQDEIMVPGGPAGGEDPSCPVLAVGVVDDVGQDETMLHDGTVGAEDSTRPVVAQPGTLKTTSRDRHDILLAKLPKRFHLIVGDAFGGPTLAHECAQGIARRMMADKIPLSELKRTGYPDVIIDAVKQALASCGAASMS
jgi:hypothetical protein